MFLFCFCFLNLINLLNNSEKNNKIEKAKEELLAKYKSAFLLETRTLITNDYTKAKQNIEKIKKLLPKDDDINKLVEEFNKAEPGSINLLSLENKNKIFYFCGTFFLYTYDSF